MTEERSERWRRLCEGLIGVPATEGNHLEVLRNGDEIFPAMLDAIGSARRTVDLLTYIYWSGDIAERFADALAERASAGVRVRVLLDAIGAHELDDALVERMTSSGCDVRWFRPVDPSDGGVDVNHRTHRKVLICDEQVSFTGGVGIAEEWTGDARDEHEWRDTHFRLCGPVTDGLRAAFVDNWLETGAPAFDPDVDRFPQQAEDGASTIQVVRGAAEVGRSDLATLFAGLIRSARRRIRLVTAYFNPDEGLVDLLLEAVERDVEVQVLVPGPHHDKRFVQMASEAVFGRLLDGGVTICSFQPTMLHAKVTTVDGEVATVGSANFNSRSMNHDEEVNLVVFDRDVVTVLDRHVDEDLERSIELDPAEWADRPAHQRLGERVAEAVSDLF